MRKILTIVCIHYVLSGFIFADSLSNSKDGIFIGIEGVVGDTKSAFSAEVIDIDGKYQNSPIVLSHRIIYDLGLVGGYQYYLPNFKKHGFKVSAHIYSGFGNKFEPIIEGRERIQFIYTPIKFGLDVKYLWDVLEENKQTLGLNIGLGYEFDWYVNAKAELTENGDKKSFSRIFAHGIYPVIGLHYYYSRHQFELLYRFGGLLGSSGTGKTKIDDVSADATSINTLHHQSYLTLNYAYRF